MAARVSAVRLGPAVRSILALEEALPRSAAHLQRVVLRQALGGHSAAVELESAVRLATVATWPALAATPQGARLERAAQPRALVEPPPAVALLRPAAARLKAEVLGWAGHRKVVAARVPRWVAVAPEAPRRVARAETLESGARLWLPAASEAERPRPTT